MQVSYKKKIPVDDYKNLMASAGWKILSDEQHEKALENSMCITIAEDGDKIVGMARLVGDNSTHGLICNVVVLPEYQNRGIGKKLVEMIKEYVYDNLKENEQFLIELLPTSGKRDFYIKCGFKYKPQHMDGMYLWIKK